MHLCNACFVESLANTTSTTMLSIKHAQTGIGDGFKKKLNVLRKRSCGSHIWDWDANGIINWAVAYTGDQSRLDTFGTQKSDQKGHEFWSIEAQGLHPLRDAMESDVPVVVCHCLLNRCGLLVKMVLPFRSIWDTKKLGICSKYTIKVHHKCHHFCHKMAQFLSHISSCGSQWGP